MGDSISAGKLLESMAARGNSATPWVKLLRAEGRMDFAVRGIPNRRVEAWKYSDLARALNETAPETGPVHTPPVMPGAYLASFENGVLDEEHSSFADAGGRALRRVLAEPVSTAGHVIGQVNYPIDHALVSLNTALMEDGLVLRVPKGTVLQAPLHLRFNWQGDGARAPDGRHIRVVIVLEEGAQATILETHNGAPGFATIVSELRLDAHAKLTHVRLERLGSSARQSAVTLGELDREAQYHGFYLSEGGHFARHEALLKLSGEAAQAQIDGAYLVAGTRHCDNTTVLTHAAPRTISRQVFRGVLGGQGRGVYQGCIKVQPEAQGTDARQLSRAMLLSRKARIATKPELEIFADDVKCSHGATSGELDAAQLFYLRARGIPLAEARALLIEAFLGEALAAIGSEHLREIAAASVQDWLSLHAGEAQDGE